MQTTISGTKNTQNKSEKAYPRQGSGGEKKDSRGLLEQKETDIASQKALKINRLHTKSNQNPLDYINYETRRSVITEPNGKIVFEMNDIEVPTDWSQLATDILASKYCRKAGVPGKGYEHRARDVVYRISNTIKIEGEKRGYFETSEDAETFEAELSYLMITQRGAFNSPVWFNVGL
ncbi:MAG: vitamin B12-dependent ribonucleotide reductase, partial [Candidatus Woesearchaeota archaeon]